MSADPRQQAANTIRILSAAMVEKAKSGHPGGAMGAADFIHVLFNEFIVEDPDDPTWAHRDRFFLDAGHMSPMLYSILALTGRMPIDSLKSFRQWGSETPGHPERSLKHGIENTSGPLGQGHTYGVGAAIAEKFLRERFGEWTLHNTYCFISDGGIQEEISQGAGRLAGYLGLGHLIMFYDSNHIQLSTQTSSVTNEDTAMKYESWGWQVLSIDGNNQDAIRQALTTANAERKRPTLIIGDTTMGLGTVTEAGEDFEGQVSMHGMPISSAGGSFEKTIEHLGGDPKNPFFIPKEVKDLYRESAERKRSEVTKRKAAEKAWRKDNKDKSAKLDSYLRGDVPKLDWQAIAKSQKENTATRASSSHVLSHFAENIDNMIVMSADLANSDKTDGFLKKTTPLTAGHFEGAFLHCGVSEFTMSCLAIGMGLHGGVIPVCGTFFAFSDYMKPALRMAALMEVPVKFIWTHDAFRVGEDGPTHQPVEQETQLRLLERLHNHSGKPGLLALRPADAIETTIAWKMALENTKTPTGLILTRQNVDGISENYQTALGAEKGGYVVYEPAKQPKLIIIANGSEVSTAVEAVRLLKDAPVRVVSIPSEGKFREQSSKYQQEIIPSEIPKFGITAGLAINLIELVGDISRIHSLEHFGFSAPYTKLDEEFGFTPESIAKKIKILLA